MGFTKTHIVGVFVTETVLGTLGGGVAIAAIGGVFQDTIEWLIVAACIFLIQLSVLLSSILALLFYIGSRIERATDHKNDDENHAA